MNAEKTHPLRNVGWGPFRLWGEARQIREARSRAEATLTAADAYDNPTGATTDSPGSAGA